MNIRDSSRGADALSCFCDRPSLPETLTALARQDDFAYLDCDLDVLSLVGTQLISSMISTNNGAAVVTAVGGYGAVQTVDKPYRASGERVNMRIAPDTKVTVAHSENYETGRHTLSVANAEGRIFHRIETADFYDQAVMRSIGRTASLPEFTATAVSVPSRENIVSLSAVRQARSHWGDRDTGHHLNDVMFDGGVTRRATLPHVGRNFAWQVLPDVMVSFVSHLRNEGLSCVYTVPTEGLLQAVIISLGDVSKIENMLIIQKDNRTCAIDLAQIDTMWVTHFGGTLQIEIYDVRGRAIAILGADPNGNFARWNTLLASLPPPAYALGS